MKTTNTAQYANYLIEHQKKFITKISQIPYRLHLKRLRLGRVLDVGCGAGRNLIACDSGSVGLDHNFELVRACVEQGCTAFQESEWEVKKSEYLGVFDSLLFSHVLEHMTQEEAVLLIKNFLPYLKEEGCIVVVCPQEAGFRSDSTHVSFLDFPMIRNIFSRTGQISSVCEYSFPFPRWAGKFASFNEFVCIGKKLK